MYTHKPTQQKDSHKIILFIIYKHIYLKNIFLKEASPIFTNQDLKNSMSFLIEVNDVESDIADLTDKTDNLSDKLSSLKDILDDDTGRMGYIRQLTAEFLEYLMTLNDELSTQVEIPKSNEIMVKMLGRRERKRYYMSKFRL